jgi:HpcH/HpaI aldolase/citrate lyase family
LTMRAEGAVQFTLWTEDAALAAAAATAGVGRIGPDLEIRAKRERQPEAGNLVSGHSPASLELLRPVIGRARLHARVNPPHADLAREIESYLAVGVTSVMLPMIRTVAEVREAVRWIRGRAEVIVMVENADALAIVDDLAALDGVAEIYVGANDLARSLGMPTRFAVLGSDLIARIAEPVHRHDKGFGFFGIARPDDHDLPVPSDLVYAEQVRLGATSLVLARTFRATPASLADDLASARARLAHWGSRPADELRDANMELRRYCGIIHAGSPTPGRHDLHQ